MMPFYHSFRAILSSIHVLHDSPELCDFYSSSSLEYAFIASENILCKYVLLFVVNQICSWGIFFMLIESSSWF